MNSQSTEKRSRPRPEEAGRWLVRESEQTAFHPYYRRITTAINTNTTAIITLPLQLLSILPTTITTTAATTAPAATTLLTTTINRQTRSFPYRYS